MISSLWKRKVYKSKITKTQICLTTSDSSIIQTKSQSSLSTIGQILVLLFILIYLFFRLSNLLANCIQVCIGSKLLISFFLFFWVGNSGNRWGHWCRRCGSCCFRRRSTRSWWWGWTTPEKRRRFTSSIWGRWSPRIQLLAATLRRLCTRIFDLRYAFLVFEGLIEAQFFFIDQKRSCFICKLEFLLFSGCFLLQLWYKIIGG